MREFKTIETTKERWTEPIPQSWLSIGYRFRQIHPRRGIGAHCMVVSAPVCRIFWDDHYAKAQPWSEEGNWREKNGKWAKAGANHLSYWVAYSYLPSCPFLWTNTECNHVPCDIKGNVLKTEEVAA